MLTDNDIDNLISCEKHAIRAERKKMVENNRSYRNKIFLEATSNNSYKFEMFMRQSAEFVEDFSVGLKLLLPNPTDRILILLRCQRPHDTSRPIGFDRHHDYHIHRLSGFDIESKRYDKPSRECITAEFNSFWSAVFYFSNICGILDLSTTITLPNDAQISLF